MNLKLILGAIVLNSLCISLAAAFRPPQSQTKLVNRYWNNRKNSRGARPFSQKLNPFRRGSDDDDDTDTDDSSNSSSTSGDKGKKFMVPQVNFYNSVPNGMGVIGQGIIWLREVSAALGTPLPLWIFSIPMLLLGVGLMFLPDLTTLNLPLFYPNGSGDDDPLAAFPPIIDFGELKDLDIIQKATQLLPPLLNMKRG